MRRIAIIDYGMCNLDSVRRAVEECGGAPIVTSDPRDLDGVASIILPGVGAFADAMAQLKARALVEPLREAVLGQKVPFLGICLGMQLMAEKGYEGGETAGLGILPGEVKRLQGESPHTRIPHVGWNEVVTSGDGPLFRGIANHADFYFVHSYHLMAQPENVLSRTPYCGGFVSAVGSDENVFGVQFHPEKSLKVGFQLLTNFIQL